MIKAVASIQADCERLGLEEDARVLRAWLSHSLPHLSEETEILKEIFDIYDSISILPPSTIPHTTFSLKTLPYHTTGKSVRQIMGELGYLVYLVHQHGFSQHSIHDLPDGTRSSHIKLGTIIQDLIILFGIYYNAANRKEDVLAAEAEQMFNLWNTHIGSLVTKLSESLVRTKENALEMIETEGAKRFIENNKDLKAQTLFFFRDLDQIILEIRKSFYQKNQLSFSEINNVQSLLQKLRDFLKSLKGITSSLDLEGGRYNPEALMYWSIVFSKKQEGYKSKKQKRTEITKDLLDKPYLSQYAVNLEDNSNHFQTIMKDLQSAHKKFRENLKTVVIINDKIQQIILEVINLKARVEAFIPAMYLLQTAIKEVTNAHKGEKLYSEQFAQLVQEEINKNQKNILYLGSKPSIFNILSKYLSFYPKKGIKPNKPDLKNFEIDQEVKSFENLVKLLDLNIKKGYTLWRGVFKQRRLDELNSEFDHVRNYFAKIAENPLGQLNNYEKEVADFLQVGKIFKEDGSFSASFEKNASEILKTNFYSEKSGTEQEKKEDIAHKITNFNALLQSLLADTELPEDFDIRSLQSFVEETVKEIRNKEIVYINEALLEESSYLNIERVVSRLVLLDSFQEWLKNASVIEKSSLEELQELVVKKPEEGKSKEGALKKAIIITAENKKDFYSIPVVRKDSSGGLEECRVQIGVDLASKKLIYRLDLKGSSPNSYIGGTPKSTEKLCPIEDFPQEVSNILKILNVESTRNLATNEDAMKSWYEEKVKSSTLTEQKIEQKTEEKDIKKSPGRFISTDAPKTEKEKEKEKEQSHKKRLLSPEKIREKAITTSPEIPGCIDNSTYSRFFAKRLEDFEDYEKIMMSRTETTFAYLQKTLNEATADLFGSGGPVSAFPRIVYDVYDRTSTASDSWREWKATKIEIPLHEIETLVENLVATEKIREEFTESPIENLKGIPLVTIDRIDEKFEELIKLVRQ